MKKKWICTVCGYVHEGDEAPEKCPQCKQPKSKFKELVENEGALKFVDEHVLGVAKGVDPVISAISSRHMKSMNFSAFSLLGAFLGITQESIHTLVPSLGITYSRSGFSRCV